MLDRSVEDKVKQILSVFETGKPSIKYDAVYVYRDGNGGRAQVTLSIGFTEDGGNLLKMLRFYVIANGVYASQFAPYLTQIGTGVLAFSDAFKALLKEAAQRDPFFCYCQDFAFTALYLKKGYEKAKEYGIVTNLGISVIIDSVLHGSLDKISATFKEARPSLGGDEKAFIEAYCKARESWLKSRGKPLFASSYRPIAFQIAIDNDNWDLSKPFLANGTVVN